MGNKCKSTYAKKLCNEPKKDSKRILVSQCCKTQKHDCSPKIHRAKGERETKQAAIQCIRMAIDTKTRAIDTKTRAIDSKTRASVSFV